MSTTTPTISLPRVDPTPGEAALTLWLEDRTAPAPGCRVEARVLYSAYHHFATATLGVRPLDPTRFGMALSARGIGTAKGAGGRRCRIGLRLTAPADLARIAPEPPPDPPPLPPPPAPAVTIHDRGRSGRTVAASLPGGARLVVDAVPLSHPGPWRLNWREDALLALAAEGVEVATLARDLQLALAQACGGQAGSATVRRAVTAPDPDDPSRDLDAALDAELWEEVDR